MNLNSNPTIVIDFANNLIRIHKKTITDLGVPPYILLIVNPYKKELCIIGSNVKVTGAHKIKISNSHCYELYSKSLIDTLKSVFDCWKYNQSYRITGEYIKNAQIAKFIITDSVPIKNIEHEENTDE